MADVEVRRPVALRTVPGVELAAVGTWKASTGETTFTPEDLANAVAALECPGVRNPVIKLGHDEPDSTSGVRWDGEPAVGWIGNMHMDGPKLIGDYMGLPSWLAETDENGLAVLAVAYPDRSIEIRRPFVCQIGHTHPSVITALSLLGVYAPGVGVLKSMQDVYAAFTEPLSREIADSANANLTAVTTTVRLAAAEPRPPTALEQKAGIDSDALQQAWEAGLDDLLAEWGTVTETQLDELATQVEAAVDADPSALGEIALTSAVGAALLLAAMTAVADTAMDAVIAEAASQGVTVSKPDRPDDELTAVADGVAGAMAASTASTGGRFAAQEYRPGEGKSIADKTRAYLTSLSDRFLRDQLGGALSAAQAAGRFAVLEVAPIGEWYASERIDADSCQPCREIDGRKFDTLAEAREAYPAGKYTACLGRARCRGQVFATWGTAASAPMPISTTVRLSLGGPMPAPTGVVQARVSVEDISRKYYESAGYSMWITAMHVDPLELIAADDSSGKFFRIPVTLAGENFEFGEPSEVAIEYTDVKTAAAAANRLEWKDRTASFAAAGLKPSDDGAVPIAKPADPPIAPDVTPAGAAIRKMASATQTPDADTATGQPDKAEEATNVPFDAAKYREAFGLPSELSDDEVRAHALAALNGDAPATTTPAPASEADLSAITNLTSAGQAVLVDRAQLTGLVEMARRGDQAYQQNRRNERDAFLSTAVREGRIPPASLTAYERLWDNDPEGTRQTVSLLAKNIIPVTANGFMGSADTDLGEADTAYAAMYGKEN